MWMLVFALFLFWGVVFPFSYRQFIDLGRVRYAHAISSTLSIILPLLPALLHLKDGYILSLHPPYICFGRNRDITFYSVILPLSMMLGRALCLVTIVLWTIFKASREFYNIIELATEHSKLCILCIYS